MPKKRAVELLRHAAGDIPEARFSGQERRCAVLVLRFNQEPCARGRFHPDHPQQILKQIVAGGLGQVRDIRYRYARTPSLTLHVSMEVHRTSAELPAHMINGTAQSLVRIRQTDTNTRHLALDCREKPEPVSPTLLPPCEHEAGRHQVPVTILTHNAVQGSRDASRQERRIRSNDISTMCQCPQHRSKRNSHTQHTLHLFDLPILADAVVLEVNLVQTCPKLHHMTFKKHNRHSHLIIITFGILFPHLSKKVRQDLKFVKEGSLRGGGALGYVVVCLSNV